MIKHTPLLALAAAALVACQTTGEGPVELSRSTAAGFEKYKEVDFREKAFAISQDGKAYMYMWCAHTSCSGGTIATETIYECDRRRRKRELSDQPCRVFAMGDEIVWEGAVTFPDTVAAYQLNIAEGTTLRGPADALGAVIYAPGNRADTDLPADDNRVPIYVSTMQARGWDTFKVVTNNDQLRGALGHKRAAEGIAKHIAQLREQGYRRVVVGSQSFGAWVSLVGGADPETWADANIAAVPGCCGPRTVDGEINDRFDRNRTELRPVLRDLKTPTLIFYFEGDDEFDPGGRGPVAKSALARNGIPHRVIDQPYGLRGHSAAWSAQFDYAFGQCVADFASGNTDTTACEIPPLAETKYLWSKEWTDPDAFDAARVTSADLRAHVGDTFIFYHKTGGRSAYYLQAEDRALVRRDRKGETTEEAIDLRIDGDRLCLDTCVTLYHWSGDRDFVVGVSADGEVVMQGTVLEGNPRNIQIASAPTG